MSTASRRQFLRLAGGAAAAAALPASIRRALAIPADVRSGTLQDVQHVVILMQENRAFDHYFGTLPGVRGFADRYTIPLAGGRSVWQQQFDSDSGSRVVLPYHLDQTQGNAQRVDGTPHGWSDGHAAWDEGRMNRWPSVKEVQSMGYYQQAELPFQFALAQAFTVCDAYYCAMHSSTNPNRLFHWTGTNDPEGLHGGPAINNNYDSLGASTEGYTWTTYPERLQQAGVSWKLYQNMPNNFTDNPLASFRQYRQANEQHGNQPGGWPFPPYRPKDEVDNPLYKGIANTLPNGHVTNPDILEDFREDVLNGRLPQVSWIVAPDRYAEHPGPSSPVQGGWYMQQVLDALTRDPEVWSRTVLIINFDENDGFFDHLPPPCPPSLGSDGERVGKSSISLAGETHTDGLSYGPGMRVPMLLISPWSRGGWVCSETYSHTSVLRFLEARFGVREDNLSPWRRAICGDLTRAFNFANPNDERLPRLPRSTKLHADTLRAAQQLRKPVPVPDEASQQLPVQAAGPRYARALPYALQATSSVDGIAQQLTLSLTNSGSAAAVLHVYDRLHLDRIPRRYGVDVGTTLQDRWDLSADAGHYDLSLHGPNGWHRAFVGDGSSQGLDVVVSEDAATLSLQLRLSNGSGSTRRFIITANAYFDAGQQTIDVAPGQSAQWTRALNASSGWYDFSVRLDGDSRYLRHIAGHVENGQASITDPAMGAAL